MSKPNLLSLSALRDGCTLKTKEEGWRDAAPALPSKSATRRRRWQQLPRTRLPRDPDQACQVRSSSIGSHEMRGGDLRGLIGSRGSLVPSATACHRVARRRLMAVPGCIHAIPPSLVLRCNRLEERQGISRLGLLINSSSRVG